MRRIRPRDLHQTGQRRRVLRIAGCAGALSLVGATACCLRPPTALAQSAASACCADLEATGARKGNRRVSLQVYGTISETLMWWNDGAERNAYVVENNHIKNALGFQGNARIDTEWSAGFKLELGIRAYRSNFANQLALGASNNVSITTYNTQSVTIRYANWYLDSKTWGRISVGRDNDAALGTGSVNLANPDGFSGPAAAGQANGAFFLRRSGTRGNAGLSALNWQNLAFIRNGDGPLPMDYAQTASGIRYASPFMLGSRPTSGLQGQWFWGQDDVWSLGLRYVDDYGPFRFAAAAGYSNWRGADRGMCSLGAVANDPGGSSLALGATTPQADAGSNVACSSIQASASLMHLPTGLYLSGGGSQLQDNHSQAALDRRSGLGAGANRAGDDPRSGAWWLQAGWEAKLNSLGKTTFWTQYLEYNTGLGVNNGVVQTVAASDVLNPLGATALIGGSQSRIWSLGVSQALDDAATILYAGFHNFAVEGSLISQSPVAAVQRAKANPIDDFQVFYTGATVRF